ncbi:MAG: helix-hairpin-helix domain-containing protein [Pseudobdellovibrionaceae bacterium]
MDQNQQAYLIKSVPSVTAKSALAVIDLAAEGGTVPFIARYRKEKTGNLDEVQIRAVLEAHENYNEIVKRKVFLLKEIGDQGNLTDEVKRRIDGSWDLGELEEIYRPFKKKKKTKATIARDAGLEPLALWIWDVGHGLIKDAEPLEVKAKQFLNASAKVNTYDEALKGAQDILTEKLANEPDLRAFALNNYLEKGKVISKVAKGYKPNSKYEMYKEFDEGVKSLMDSKSSHRYLAMRRGWQEEELSVEIKGDEEVLLKKYVDFATNVEDQPAGQFLAQAARMALNVYVLPSVVNEVHRHLKEKADDHAIKVFAENVRRLLLASPYGPKCVLGVDPGLRTGSKVALIDKGGNFISHTVVHVLGDAAEEKAKALFGEVTKQIQIDAIAVGNGTAGRETEIFLRKIMKDLGKNIPVIMVNESGASVYSASDVAREEFPDLDITVRGAISIARRLQDPLAELVKVDPKSIGVGQYQHDVQQTSLKKSLEAVVESCVNTVGVDLNTASAPLLSVVSGIGPALAKNIIEQRKTKGLFSDRSDLLKIPKFSTKVFEQSAGFLRIFNGKAVLDSTGIHPERYPAVRDMASDLGVGISDLIGAGAKKLLEQRTKWAALVGEYTFDDIVRELEKPGRDPRDPFKVFQFREDIFEVKDLNDEMICPGIVTNVTNFGAFVDIGVHQDGLVHISEISHQFVDDPRKVVNPGDQVQVKVLKVDKVKNQISLTMKLDAAPAFAQENVQQQPRPNKARGGGDRSRSGGGDAAGGGGAKPAPAKPARLLPSWEQKGEPPPQFPLTSPAPERSSRPAAGSGGGQQGRGGGRDSGSCAAAGGRKPPTPTSPFNNPFAALLGNKK